MSYQNILKSFSFSLRKSRFTTCALFQFPSYVQFYKFLWVVVSTHTYTHQKSYFSFQSHVGTIRRLLVTEVPGGWFTRLLIERGPMPRCATHITHLLNRLKTNKIVSQHVHKSMTLGHIFQNLL